MGDNFQNRVFKLKPIDLNEIRNDIMGLLIYGEEPVMAFRDVRDQVVFTNKRIITINIQGITGRRRLFETMPYSKIQYFSVQTPGFIELIPDSELFIRFTGFSVNFEFKGYVDIGSIARIISEFVL